MTSGPYHHRNEGPCADCFQIPLGARQPGAQDQQHVIVRQEHMAHIVVWFIETRLQKFVRFALGSVVDKAADKSRSATADMLNRHFSTETTT